MNTSYENILVGMTPQRKRFETTAATRHGLTAAPREALALCRASIERGTAANDNSFFQFDANHNVLTATDAAGQVWRYAWNTAGQMIYASNPQNQTRFWEYDASGWMTRYT